MAWDANSPSGTNSPSASTVNILGNWEWIHASLSAEHLFPGTMYSNAGRHMSGQCSVVKKDTLANLNAMADVYGGLGYATDESSFYANNGSGWVCTPGFPSGTVAVFYQGAAPAGWTIHTNHATYDDACVMISSGADLGGFWSGGDWNVDGMTINHAHNYSTTTRHRHSITCYYYTGGADVKTPQAGKAWGAATTKYTGYTGAGAPATTQFTNAAVTGDGTWRPAYAAVLLCVKD